MGFKEARTLLIEALQSDRHRAESRSDINEKNLLHTGVVTPEFVVYLLYRCAGWEYETSKHHFHDTWCHTFTPHARKEQWYIKAYFLPEDEAVFISVHP